MSRPRPANEPPPDAWRNDDGSRLRVGTRIRKPIAASFALLVALVLIAAATAFIVLSPPTVGKWVSSGICLLIALGALHGVLWLGFGSCELTFTPGQIILRQQAGPLVYTKRMSVSDLRKVERVEQVNSRNGKRISTIFYVFGPGRRWRFGESLSLAAADHLWADLSRGRKSSTRTEQVDPNAD